MPNYKYLGNADLVIFSAQDFVSGGVNNQGSVTFRGKFDVRALSEEAFELLMDSGYPLALTNDPVGSGSPLPAPGDMATQVELDELAEIVTLGRFPQPRGAVCFSWDDGWASCLPVAAIHEARGQRATFAITKNLIGTANHISAANVTALAAAGHEIAAHSVTHSNFVTTLTAAQRAAELAESKAYVEGLTGKPCTTWVYPFGGSARNATTDQEAYLVYERLLDVAGNYGRPLEVEFVSPLTQRMNLTGTTANHEYAKGLIRQAAARRVVVQLLCHQLDINGAPTTAQYTELCDLALSLGVPAIRTDAALPGASNLTDAGFEDPNLGAWEIVRDVGTQVVESVLDTPAVGLSGNRSLHLAVSNGGFAYVTQPYEVRPGFEQTFSGRYRTAVGVGNWVITARCRQLDYTQNAVGGAPVGGTVNESSGWSRFSFAFTPHPLAKYVHFDLLADAEPGLTAEAWFDHVHIGPTLLGSFG